MAFAWKASYCQGITPSCGKERPTEKTLTDMSTMWLSVTVCNCLGSRQLSWQSVENWVKSGVTSRPYPNHPLRRGSRKNASGVKGKCFSWIPHIKRKHFSLNPHALLLDPRRNSSWPPTHFSLTPDAHLRDLEGLFFRVEKTIYLNILICFSG